MSENISKQQG